MKKYNVIAKNKSFYSVNKYVFDYLDYEEFIHLKIFRNNKVLTLDYSITYNDTKTSIKDLNDLPKIDSYYGRWMKGHVDAIKKASKLEVSNEVLIKELIERFPEAKHKESQLLEILNSIN